MTTKTIYIDGADKDLSMMNQGIIKAKRGRKPKDKLLDNSEKLSIINENSLNDIDRNSNIKEKKSEIMSIVEKYSQINKNKDIISSKLPKFNTNTSLQKTDDKSLQKLDDKSLQKLDDRSLQKLDDKSLQKLDDRSLQKLDDMSLKSLSKHSKNNKELINDFFNKSNKGDKSNLSTINTFFKNKLDKLESINEIKSNYEKKDNNNDEKKDNNNDEKKDNNDDEKKDNNNETAIIEKMKIELLKEKEEKDKIKNELQMERDKIKNEIQIERDKLKDELQIEKDKLKDELKNEQNLRLLKEKEFYENQEKIKNEKIRLKKELDKIENDKRLLKEKEQREKNNIMKQKKTLNKYKEQIKKIISKKRENNKISKKRENNKINGTNNRIKVKSVITANGKKKNNDINSDEVSNFSDIIKNISIFNNNDVDNYYTKNISLSINDLKCPEKIINKKKLDRKNMKKILYKNNIIKHLDTPDEIIEHIYNMTDEKLLK